MKLIKKIYNFINPPLTEWEQFLLDIIDNKYEITVEEFALDGRIISINVKKELDIFNIYTGYYSEYECDAVNGKKVSEYYAKQYNTPKYKIQRKFRDFIYYLESNKIFVPKKLDSDKTFEQHFKN